MKRITFLLLPLLLLTSCSTRSDEKIRMISNYNLSLSNDSFIKISAENIINKIDNKESFFLYLFSSSCAYCELTSNSIKEIQQNTPYTIYQYEASINSYKLLYEYNHKIFPEQLVTPRLITIKNGELKIDINSNRLIKTNLLKNSLESFSYKTNIFTLTKKESFLDFINQKQSFLLFNYSSTSLIEQNLKNDILNQLDNSKKPILILDNIDIDDELNEYLMTNINKISYDNYIVTYSNNTYSNYLETNLNNETEIFNIINCYYND
ncbi:MAG: hypothetical protein ACI31G_01955 [Bacilli bacterium]